MPPESLLFHMTDKIGSEIVMVLLFGYMNRTKTPGLDHTVKLFVPRECVFSMICGYSGDSLLEDVNKVGIVATAITVDNQPECGKFTDVRG